MLRPDHNDFDNDLLTSIADGDQAAFVTLYNRYWERLLSFAQQKTGDLMEAENVVQDVFISLWKRRTEIKTTSTVAAYLMVSVKYRIIRLLSEQRARRKREQDSVEEFSLLDDSTQQYLDLEELREQLEISIAKLPETSALVFRMAKQDGLSYSEISEQLNISQQSVNAHMVRAKRSLTLNLRTFLHTFLL